MNETFASLVTAVEEAVKPLGFKIETSTVKPDIFGHGARSMDAGEMRIIITRRVNKALTWVDLSGADNPDNPEKAQ